MTTRLVPYQSAEPPEAPIGATVQTVIDTLFARIEAKEYEVDERLPSERTLAAELGVARNTVREALDVLETRRVIRRRAGSGSFVTYQSEVGRNSAPSALASNTSPLHHLVVRGILEPEIVRLAIINMTPRQIDLLGETLSQMEQIRTDATAFASQEEELTVRSRTGPETPCLPPAMN